MKKIATLILILSLCSCVIKEKSIGNMSGVITDCDTGLPIKNELLVLLKSIGEDESEIIGETETNSNGEYEFSEDIGQGSYSIRLYNYDYLDIYPDRFWVQSPGDEIRNINAAPSAWLKFEIHEELEYFSLRFYSNYNNEGCNADPKDRGLFNSNSLPNTPDYYQLRGNSDLAIEWSSFDFPDIEIADTLFVPANDTLVYKIKY